MTRLIRSSLIAVVILAGVAFGLYYLINRGAGTEAVFRSVPGDALCVIQLKPNEANANRILKNFLFTKFKNVPGMTEVNALLQKIANGESSSSSIGIITRNDLYISIHQQVQGKLDFMYYLPQLDITEDQVRNTTEAIWGKVDKVEKRNFNGTDVLQLYIGKSILNFASFNNVMAVSFNPLLIEDAIRQSNNGSNKDDNTWRTYYNDKNIYTNGDIQVYVQHANCHIIWQQLFKNAIPDVSFGNFASYMAEVDEYHLTLAGNTAYDASSFLSIFQGQKETNNGAFNALPANAAWCKSYAFTDKNLLQTAVSNVYRQNGAYQKALQTVTAATPKGAQSIDALLNEMIDNEISLIALEAQHNGNGNGLVAVIANENARSRIFRLIQYAKKNAPVQLESEKYKESNLVKLPECNALQVLFGNDFAGITQNYVANVGEFLVVANQLSDLKTYIETVKANRLIKQENEFELISSKVNANCNYLIYVNTDMALNNLEPTLNETWKSNYQAYQMQLETSGMFFYTAQAKETYCASEATVISSRAIKDILYTRFTSDMPEVNSSYISYVKTDNDSIHLIALQDTLDNILLVNNKGAIEHRIHFNDKIKGDIYCLDLNQTGNYHLLFNTDTLLYVINLSGMTMEGFPKRLPARASASLSVFDFSESKQYRIYMPCENANVYCYTSSGIPIQEWNYQASTQLTEPLTEVVCNNGIWLKSVDVQNRIVQIDKLTGALLDGMPSGAMVKNNSQILIDAKNCAIEYLDTTGILMRINKEGITAEVPLIGMPYTYVITAELEAEGNTCYVTIDDQSISAYTLANDELFHTKSANIYAMWLGVAQSENNNRYVVWLNNEKNKLFMADASGKEIKGSNMDCNGIPILCELNNDGNTDILILSGTTLKVISLK
ncbi:MAG: hypothetical protein IPO27_18465 [Bacteroidetes bacterium]|nr:hypothetical protein [Bacteroidota bacterium]